MKKIVLSVMMVGALVATSCKSEKKDVKDAAKEVKKEVVIKAKEEVKDVKNVVADAVNSALDGVKIPSFSNAEVTENLKAYAAYAKDYIAADGNVVKITAMASKGIALVKKGKELASTLGADEMKKFKGVMSMIQSKMAPSK